MNILQKIKHFFLLIYLQFTNFRDIIIFHIYFGKAMTLDDDMTFDDYYSLEESYLIKNKKINNAVDLLEYRNRKK